MLRLHCRSAIRAADETTRPLGQTCKERLMKRQSLTVTAIAAALALAGVGGCATAGESGFTAQHRSALDAAIAAGTRTPANVARDRYRNPGPTLAFFGVRPSDTVVEIWPGGGWYTEILAPYLKQGGGTYYAVANGQGLARMNEWRTAKPELYGDIKTAAFPAWEATDVRVPDGSADVVLTFRNVHNFRMGYQRPDKQDYTLEAFRQAYRMLKPGGVLGVVDHRLPENADAERERSSGYIKQSTVVRLAQEAGFRLAATSEINANPRDTADWPQGVWTLPPALRLGDKDRERYLAIGESDRMTLKFVKPR
jgi:predicted methyltransferase